MSSPDPFRAVPRQPKTPVQPDGRHVAGDTPYRTRAGKPLGLDWDALGRKDTEETA